MNELKRLNGLGIVGAIINIIFAMGMLIIILVITFNYLLNPFYDYYNQIDYFRIILTTLILSLAILISLLSIITNGKLLRGKLSQRGPAIVFSFLTLSILGASFLLFSKVIVNIERIKIKIKVKEINGNELINDLLTYKELLDSGVITNDEYKIIKGKYLKLL